MTQTTQEEALKKMEEHNTAITQEPSALPPRSLSQKADLAFSAIWGFTLVSSVWLAYQSYLSGQMQLMFIDFPTFANSIRIGNLDVGQVVSMVSSLKDVQNANASILQTATKQSALTMVVLNSIAALMSFIGLVTQFTLYREKERNRKSPNRNVESTSSIPEQNVENMQREG